MERFVSDGKERKQGILTSLFLPFLPDLQNAIEISSNLGYLYDFFSYGQKWGPDPDHTPPKSGHDRGFHRWVERRRCETMKNRFSKNLISNFGSLSEKLVLFKRILERVSMNPKSYWCFRRLCHCSSSPDFICSAFLISSWNWGWFAAFSKKRSK